jgi:hypothetical protein
MLSPDPVDPRAVLRLLRGIDALTRGASGALTFSERGSPWGTILIEDRRICWAAASNMQNRLTDILRTESEQPRPASSFEDLYQECSRKSLPLGETLVARGLVSSKGFKRALRQHTAEAVAHLAAAAGLTLTWTSDSSKRYDAQFTFGTTDLACCIGAFGCEEVAEEAAQTLLKVTPDSSVGAAFPADEARSLPLAQVSADAWCCQSLVDLGEWARAALATGEGEESVRSVLGSDAVSSLKRAWRSGELLFVRWTGDRVPPPSASEKLDLAEEIVITR